MTRKQNAAWKWSLSILSILLLSACSTDASSDEVVEVNDTPVAVAHVSYGTLAHETRMTGRTQAANDLHIIPKMAGELEEVYVSEGDSVSEGDLLARVDDYDASLNVRQEEAQVRMAQQALERAEIGRQQAEQNVRQSESSLEQAERAVEQAEAGFEDQKEAAEWNLDNAEMNWEEAKDNLERTKELYEQGFVYEQQSESAELSESQARMAFEEAEQMIDQADRDVMVDDAKTSLEQAESSLEQAEISVEEAASGVEDARIGVEQAEMALEMARKQLEDTEIRAPADGEITNIMMNAGEMVSNQEPLVQLISANQMEVELHVSAQQATLLDNSDEVDVRFQGLEETVTGTVSYTSSTIDDTGMFPAKITLDEQPEDVRSGVVATVSVDENLTEESLLIPSDALVEAGNETFVYLVEDDSAVRTNIDVERVDTVFSAVSGDVSEGDAVIVTGQTLVEDGGPVDIVREEDFSETD
ncbi:efflux RND transporter periplasmic adaptor subunit [Texcoconibacillus texcoconensis]|uniref:RND family efflux transporter MFP subunit n=1 Tax=Texcoconibacillus texcoconensis TaxID=1095777 RepID=A0A840QPZ2_9BACI|nr:efflux RND transporter periplasmic adaptor subunit [Texcoconibacillus texcoconensis]MBB5173492.1 RND family efflux transporter MFP subunit [Texcoconibacillus texcoconensis]